MIQEVAGTNRKIMTLLLCCLLLSGLNMTAHADTEGSQTITTTVPCTVMLEIGEHGSVTADGTKYTGKASFQREPGAVLTYIITPDSGYEFSKVSYNGKDVTSAVKSGRYKAAALKDNVKLTVRFVQQTSSGSPRTGDDSRIELWIALMCVSGIALIIPWRRKRRRV